MPRLIRRLAAFLEADAAGKVIYRQRRPKVLEKPKSGKVPNPSGPILARGRTRSLLLDTNPIIDKEAYYVPKQPPPVLPSQKRQKQVVDGKRLMNELEIDTMASPYARMLSSPLRTCIFTKAILPNDLLIRFGGAVDPTTRTRYLLPNDIEHPKYSKRVNGVNFWVSCWKEAVRYMIATNRHRAVIPELTAHPQIIPQIEHLLQKRVVQEMTLLRDRLRSTPQRMTDTRDAVVIQLSSHEWQQITAENKLHLSEVSAILSMSNAANTLEPLPFCQFVEDLSLSPPRRLVPLYNLTQLPPDVSQAVRDLLKGLSQMESAAQKKLATQKSSSTLLESLEDSEHESSVYLLRSSPNTLPRADSVPLFIALWRLRLWAGEGWHDGLWGKWEHSHSSNR